MLDAALEAVSFAADHERADLDSDRLLVLGLLKCVEIIGEAAVHVSEKTRLLYPQIPWAAITGMRNRLVHVYFDIDLDQVWEAVIKDVPPLIVELEKILGLESDT